MFQVVYKQTLPEFKPVVFEVTIQSQEGLDVIRRLCDLAATDKIDVHSLSTRQDDVINVLFREVHQALK